MLFWLDLSRSGQITTRSCRISLRSHRISSDLVGSDGISSNLRQRTPNTAGFCKFSSKILQIIAGGFWFYDRVEWLGFRGRKPTNRLEGCRVLWAATRNQHRSGRFRQFPVQVWAGCSGWSVLRVGWTVLCKPYA